jgi:signal transduction histidine kinase
MEAVRIDISNQLQDAEITGDQTAVQIIIKNLLENSIRHSGRDELKIILSSERTASGCFVINYRDNGRGVESHQLPKLGRLFEKGADSHGAGVGLYLVESLMQRMGGEVEFSGSDGFGAKLIFSQGAKNGT